MNHEQMHIGCQNKAYKGLRAEPDANALSLVAAKSKLDTLASNAFPQEPTVDEMCDLLHDVACVTDAAGKVERSIQAGRDHHHLLAASPMAIPFIDMMALEFRKLLKEFLSRLLKWLRTDFGSPYADFVEERLLFIMEEGLRQGDKALWKYCLLDGVREDEDFDFESGQASNASQEANSFVTEGRLSGFPDIPVFFVSQGAPDRIVMDLLKNLVEEATKGSAESGQAPSMPPTSQAPSIPPTSQGPSIPPTFEGF